MDRKYLENKLELSKANSPTSACIVPFNKKHYLYYYKIKFFLENVLE